MVIRPLGQEPDLDASGYRDITELRWRDAAIVGLAQVGALLSRKAFNEFRRRLGIPIAEEVEAEGARVESAREERLQRAYAALEKEEAEAKKEPRPLLSNLH